MRFYILSAIIYIAVLSEHFNYYSRYHGMTPETMLKLCYGEELYDKWSLPWDYLNYTGKKYVHYVFWFISAQR